MKLLKSLLAVPLAAMTLLFLPATVTFAAQTSYELTSEVSKQIDSFVTFAQDETLSDADYFEQYPLKSRALESKIDDTIAGLRVASNATSLGSIITQLGNMKSALEDSRQALSDGDSDAFTTAANKFDAAVTAYNAAIDSANKEATGFTEQEQTYVYWGLLGGSAVLAAGTLLWWRNANAKSKLHPTHSPEAETMLAKMRQGIFINSLWPVGGSAITLATYLFSTDGSYFIMWGPIGVGFVFYLVAIVNYTKELKKLKATPTMPSQPQPPAAMPPTAPVA